MKKWIALLLALVMVLSLCACGKEPAPETPDEPVSTDEPAPEKPAEPVDEPEDGPAVSLDPVTAQLGDFEVTIQAAEEFVNIDDLPGIRFYYDFTNGSDYLTNAWAELNLEVTQDGKVLDTTYAPSEEDVPEYGKNDDDIIPGLTVRCIGEYLYDPEGGIVYLTIEEGYSGDSMTMEFEPAYLQGRPEALELPVISDPDFTAGMSMEGSLEDGYDIVIEGFEIVEGYDGEEVLRVLFTFTNNSEEATSAFMVTFLQALQDGIELEESFADEDAETDENYNVDVAPGESILCSVCFEIRSDSPVEFMVHDGWDNPEIGTIFDIA